MLKKQGKVNNPSRVIYVNESPIDRKVIRKCLKNTLNAHCITIQVAKKLTIPSFVPSSDKIKPASGTYENKS
jgi:hypothetical protein